MRQPRRAALIVATSIFFVVLASFSDQGIKNVKQTIERADAFNRRVDEGLDIAMRVRKPPLEDSDLVMRTFGPDEMILVACPALIAEHGKPQTLDDIARMPTLSMASAGERSTWRFLGMAGEPTELTHSPRLRTDDLFTLRRAALLGIGAVLLPRLIVAKDLERGALIRLLPSLKAHTGLMHAIFPSRRGMVPAVRSLLDSLSEGLTVSPAPENQI